MQQILSKVFFLLILILTLTACSTQNNTEDTSIDSVNSSSFSQTQQEGITLLELAQNDGKNGNKCYVAVDGIVYEITDSAIWNDSGQHTTSGGLAFCGADMSDIITQSPHGKSKLQTSSKVQVVGELIE